MFRQLVARYEEPLIQHLIGRLRNENEAVEAAQESMVRAYFSLRKLKRAESFPSWLLGISDRVALEMRRARRRQPATLDVVSGGSEPFRESYRSELSDARLKEAIADLPEGCREVVVLRFYSGQSCSEISDILGISLGTVTSRLSRAYSLLRVALEQHPVDQECES
jgi:RNA polymerase sigma-70 factor (ECF subfamily)